VKKKLAATPRRRAVDALRKVLEGGARAAPLVGELSRGLSGADQDLLRELVLGVLRWKLALDAEIASVSRVPLGKLAPNLREILEVGLYQLRHLDRVPAYAAVHEAVGHARASGGDGAARLVNGILRNILLLPAPEKPREAGGGRREAEELARFFSHPLFLVERWLERFGPETTRRVLALDNTPSRLDLLSHPRALERDALRARLREDGVLTEPSALVPLALTVTSGNPLRSPLHAEGAFSIQDVGSQLLPLLLPAGSLLIDLAAAPGGKSLSAVAHGKAMRTAAVDRSLPRLRLLAENTRRLGYREIHPVAGDLAALPLRDGGFDRALLDAPCSGTGTLRKNPEIRYRLTAEAIERLSRDQEAVVERAAGLLSPGGYLLYSTCSLEWEENERVVERVMARRAGMRLRVAPIDFPAALTPTSAGGVRIFPDESADGFTAHLLRREPEATRTASVP
jgi:16S rRNA (cytosine967-C5)-methyltransferase